MNLIVLGLGGLLLNDAMKPREVSATGATGVISTPVITDKSRNDSSMISRNDSSLKTRNDSSMKTRNDSSMKTRNDSSIKSGNRVTIEEDSSVGISDDKFVRGFNKVVIEEEASDAGPVSGVILDKSGQVPRVKLPVADTSIKFIPKANEVPPSERTELLSVIEARYKELYREGVRLKNGKNQTDAQKEMRQLYARRRRLLDSKSENKFWHE